MKKFTCLLVAFLAISTVYSTCPAVASSNSMQITIAYYTNSEQTDVSSATAGVNSDAGVCGASAGTGTLCCDPTKTKAAVSTEITKAKNQYLNFGSKIGTFGAMMAKVATLVNASTAQTTLGTAVTGENSGATADQLKAFAQYTPAQYATDFAAFKDQVAGCYDYHASAIQKSACDGCGNDANKAEHARWAPTETSVHIKQASCNDWATKCNKVWNFLHKAGWFIHTVAFLNKKKEATAGAVTFTAPTTVYATGAASIADINTALASCGTDAAAAACTDAFKANLCKSFISLWSGPADTTIAVGRSSRTFFDGYNPTSTVTRRILAVPAAKLTGALTVADATGFDTTSTNTAVFPPTATIATITPTEWSSGYVATSTGGSSGSSGTSGSSSGSTSSAKVVISTILSALFAIALLN